MTQTATRLKLATLTVGVALMFATPSFAQGAPEPTADEAKAEQRIKGARAGSGAVPDPSQQVEEEVEEEGALEKQALEHGLTPQMVDKLSAGQLEDILIARAALANGKKASMGVETLVPLGFFLMVFAIVIGVALFRYRTSQQRHQTLRLMVERGAEIPPEMLMPKVRPASDLRRGLVLTCLGVGVGLFLLLTGGVEGAALGLVPTFLGVGYLLSAKLSPKDEPADPGSGPVVPPTP